MKMKIARLLITMAAGGAALTALALSPSPALAGESSPEDEARPEERATGPLGLRPLSLEPEFRGDSAQDDGVAIHIVTTRKRYYRRRYYRTHVHHHPYNRTVVVVRDPPPPQIVTDPPIRKNKTRGVSLSLRTVGITFDEKRSGSLEGNDAAGFGLGLRLDLDKHWGLELAADLAGGRTEDSQIALTPLSASLMARLFPESRFDIYGLAGVAVIHTAIDNRIEPDETFMQLGAHLGVGAELKFGHLLLTGDMRYLFLQPRPGPVQTQRPATTNEQGLTEGDDDAQVVREKPEEGFDGGVQVMLGIGYRW